MHSLFLFLFFRDGVLDVACHGCCGTDISALYCVKLASGIVFPHSHFIASAILEAEIAALCCAESNVDN